MSVTAFNNYSRVNWKNGPSGGTPWSADNLNIMDAGIKTNNDMIKGLIGDVSELNNNIIGRINELIINGSINYDSSIFDSKKSIYVHAIATEKDNNIIGFPRGAYGYGLLITIFSTITAQITWGSAQIYIPHNSHTDAQNKIYVRTFADGNMDNNSTWREIQGTIVSAIN